MKKILLTVGLVLASCLLLTWLQSKHHDLADFVAYFLLGAVMGDVADFVYDRLPEAKPDEPRELGPQTYNDAWDPSFKRDPNETYLLTDGSDNKPIRL